MSGFVKASLRFDLLTPHIAAASKIIKDYTAIFIFDDGRIGSGTFVNTCGVHGILTAYHVAEHLLKFQEFALCMADSPSGDWIPSNLVEHFPVGSLPEGSAPEDGPDLSFLIIRDTGLLEKLRTVKLFYPLDSSNRPSFHPLLNPRIWGVAGSPCESLERIEDNYQGGPLSKLLNFVGTGCFPFQSLQEGEFDYFKLTVPSGKHGFPDDYDGMSGGGFWLMPMEIDSSGDPHTIGHRAPILAGVEFAQSGWRNHERILTGHGSRSIYTCLRQALETKP
jgi:hypothetical protein